MRSILAFRALVGLVMLLPLPGLFGAVYVDADSEWREAPSTTREYAFAKRHLESSFDGYSQSDVLAPPFAVVALSHFAAGLMNVWIAEHAKQAEVAALLDEVARRAMHPRVVPAALGDRQPFDATSLDDENLYLSHLGVILGARRIVSCAGDRPCPSAEATDAVHKRVVTHLRDRTLGSPLAHAPSYPGSPMWPADQAVTLLALRLYDEIHATHLLDAPLEGWLGVMKKQTDPTTGLFHSSVSPLVYATTPRGCALSWTSLYFAQVAPDVAREQYARYREHLGHDVLGYGGFREWPEGREKGGMDADSGPIIFGVGMAATGLGLGPARLFHDADRYATIRRTALTFGMPSVIPSHGYNLAPVLGEAILFHGRTARPWFDDAPAPVKAPRTSAFSFSALVFLLGYLTLVGLWVRRSVASLRRSQASERGRVARLEGHLAS